MKVDVSHSGPVAVAGVSGRVDSSNASEFDQLLSEAMAVGTKSLVIDAADLVYLSSAGLRAILLAVKRAHGSGGKVAVCGVPAHILEVLEVSGFSRLVKITSDVDSALAAVS